MEVLSPSGNYQSALAALLGGADAIYLGGKAFSARMSAENFTNEELERIVNLAHSVRKKVFVTLNTMIFQDEFTEAVEFARFLRNIHVDGIIVQDLGLAHYLHQCLPSLPLHASTQINCHNLAMAKALKRIGFVRVVLAREAGIPLIRQVKSIGLEVEVFVHGALCVCYSGNCLLSSFIGGRSGNRGRCAQPCRMKYDLLEDGKTVKQGVYEISTKDLMTLGHLDKLKEAGVDSLKIEGRLKNNEYIFQSTKAYRHAVDALEKGIPNDHEKEDVDILSMTYSRGFTKGYILNESPFSLLNQVSNSHQGERIGKVVWVRGNRVGVLLETNVQRLDGIRFNNDSQIGLTIERMFIKGQPQEKATTGQVIELSGIEHAEKVKGAPVIRTTNIALIRQVEEELRGKLKMALSGTLFLSPNKPMGLQVRVGDIRVDVEGVAALVPEKGGTPISRIKEQMAKSGDYPYFFEELKVVGPECFVPISGLNQLRNAAYAKVYDALVGTKEDIGLLDYPNADFKLNPMMDAISSESKEIAQLLNKEGMRVFEFQSKEARLTNRVDPNGDVNGTEVICNFIIEKKDQSTLIASPYCNIANSYALDCFYSMGFDGCVASLETDLASISAMSADFYNRHGFVPNLGMQLYGKVDLMVMKSCPIGTTLKNKGIHCNRCHRSRYELADKMGVCYRLVGDSNCNTRVLSERPISLIGKEEELHESGVNFFAVCFIDETYEIAEEIVESYKARTAVEAVPVSKGHFEQRAK